MKTEHTIHLDDKIIPYTIQKRKNCKHVIIKILHGTIRVSAPLYMVMPEIIEFVETKKDWLIENLPADLEQKQSLFRQPQLLFRGKTYGLIFYYEDRQTIKIIENDERAVLQIYLNPLTTDEQLVKAVKRFLLKEAKVLVDQRINILTQRDDVKKITTKYLHNHRVRFLKTAFGLCYPTKNEIVLNTELVLYDITFLDYVILHEITHFLHQNHSQAFYQAFAKLDPEWKEHKKQLNALHQVYGGWSRR